MECLIGQMTKRKNNQHQSILFNHQMRLKCREMKSTSGSFFLDDLSWGLGKKMKSEDDRVFACDDMMFFCYPLPTHLLRNVPSNFDFFTPNIYLDISLIADRGSLFCQGKLVGLIESFYQTQNTRCTN